MVELVIIINILLALILLHLAGRLWRIRLSLAKAANALVAAERSTHTVLAQAPNFIYVGQRNISNLRLRNQVLELQIQQLRQVLSLLLLISQIWQRYFRLYFRK
ncbi:hypothetical protein NIES4101_82210 [Calothrix sp. NIES-4101]|nr:hypothetical protein NIES4101_82210 [Calothrix sp. NIES-4101]